MSLLASMMHGIYNDFVTSVEHVIGNRRMLILVDSVDRITVLR